METENGTPPLKVTANTHLKRNTVKPYIARNITMAKRKHNRRVETPAKQSRLEFFRKLNLDHYYIVHIIMLILSFVMCHKGMNIVYELPKNSNDLK
jgi:hypothetical protein